MDLVARVVARYAALQKFSEFSVGETFENELWRVHRFRFSIRVTDLANAGRRGKKCVQFSVYNRDFNEGPPESLAMEFLMLAKRKESVQRMRQAMAEAKEVGLEVEEDILRGVDVSPGNFEKLLVRGAHVTIEARFDGFTIEDINDEYNEPTCIAKGKKGIGVFYRWVKDNMRRLQSMTMEQIIDEMRKLGIDYHYYCAMD